MATSKEEFEAYLKKAHAGDARAQCQVGWCYITGQGVQKNDKKGVEYYRKSAKQNRPHALNNLAYCYEIGRVVKKDLKTAFSYYLKAAKLKDRLGMSNLAACYRDGIGVEVNLKESFYWYKRLLKQSLKTGREGVHLLAAYRSLAWFFYSGVVVPRNTKKALDYYERAAKMGDERAQYQLGAYFLYVQAERSEEIGLSYLKQSSEKGYKLAKQLLAQYTDFNTEKTEHVGSYLGKRAVTFDILKVGKQTVKIHAFAKGMYKETVVLSYANNAILPNSKYLQYFSKIRLSKRKAAVYFESGGVLFCVSDGTMKLSSKYSKNVLPHLSVATNLDVQVAGKLFEQLAVHGVSVQFDNFAAKTLWCVGTAQDARLSLKEKN